MNYLKVYNNIIFYRKNNQLCDEYTECHHIIPRSLGGNNNDENLVNLSAKEHFVCHLLLTKIYKNDFLSYKKMIKAFMMMRCSTKTQKHYISSKIYAKLKNEFSKIQSESQSGIGNSQYNTKWINNNGIIKKICKDKLDFYLSNGWKIGKVDKEERKKIKNLAKRKHNERKIINKFNKMKEYTEYYNVYKTYGFEEVVKQFNYPYTKQNLVQGFATFVEDFIPQNGKKRKIV